MFDFIRHDVSSFDMLLRDFAMRSVKLGSLPDMDELLVFAALFYQDQFANQPANRPMDIIFNHAAEDLANVVNKLASTIIVRLPGHPGLALEVVAETIEKLKHDLSAIERLTAQFEFENAVACLPVVQCSLLSMFCGLMSGLDFSLRTVDIQKLIKVKHDRCAEIPEEIMGF